MCLSVCSLLRYRLNVFLPPLPEVGFQIFLELRNPWGKVMERSGRRFEHFCFEVVLNSQKKKFVLADFALQNTVETMLPDGWHISRCFLVFMFWMIFPFFLNSGFWVTW